MYVCMYVGTCVHVLFVTHIHNIYASVYVCVSFSHQCKGSISHKGDMSFPRNIVDLIYLLLEIY